MRQWLRPHWDSCLLFQDLPIEHFIERNIKLLILDADKTLVNTKETEPEVSVKNWIELANEKFHIHIVSNNPSKKRISTIAHHLKLPYTYLAGKPRSKSIKKIILELSMNKKEIALIGDRIFTDILVGNRLGLYTVLVKPISIYGNQMKDYKLQNLEKRFAKILGAQF